MGITLSLLLQTFVAEYLQSEDSKHDSTCMCR